MEAIHVFEVQDMPVKMAVRMQLYPQKRSSRMAAAIAGRRPR
ncbi:hypothetical protein ACFHWW_02925 [Ensifer sp. P24N7]